VADITKNWKKNYNCSNATGNGVPRVEKTKKTCQAIDTRNRSEECYCNWHTILRFGWKLMAEDKEPWIVTAQPVIQAYFIDVILQLLPYIYFDTCHKPCGGGGGKYHYPSWHKSDLSDVSGMRRNYRKFKPDRKRSTTTSKSCAYEKPNTKI
jgi:hypothetical protein